MNSKFYELEELISKQRQIADKHRDIILKTHANLTALFPVCKKAFTTISNPWAFKCLCGKYVVMCKSSVFTGKNLSCGCLRKKKAEFKTLCRIIKNNLSTDTKYVVTSQGTDYRSRDWGIFCTKCGTSTISGCLHEHIFGEREFCKCSKCYKASTEEIKQACLSYAETSHWSILSFPDTMTTKKELRINLVCDKCGHKVSMLYGNFVRGKGCQGCSDLALADRLSKDLSYFLEKSIGRHGYLYDYSKVVYDKCRLPVEIICKEHGPFWQSPDNHYNKGKGCPECKKKRLKYVAFHKSAAEENKSKYIIIPSGVYIMKVGSYRKIGIAVIPDKRMKEIKNKSGLPCEILKYRKMSLYDALVLEHELHKVYDKFRSDVIEQFDGWTECFNLTDDQVEEVWGKIKSYKQQGDLNE